MKKKYKAIYADPAWTFKTYSDKGKEKKSAENHYDCMTLEDIYNLPVNEISADDCVLFLWVTNPLLQEGLECIKRWGFTYKTVGFSWYKKNKIASSYFWGLGYWTRANVELCLLATKGEPKRISKSVHQVLAYDSDLYDIDFSNFNCLDTEQVATKIRKHSQKPDEVRERIVELCGDVPRIELFARNVTEGWDVWGNDPEVAKKSVDLFTKF